MPDYRRTIKGAIAWSVNHIGRSRLLGWTCAVALGAIESPNHDRR
jgi:hypothetical protein